MINFERADKNMYLDFKHQLEALYIETFTTGLSAQLISKDEAEKYLKEIFNQGYGIFGFEDNNLISALMATPVSFDNKFPEDLKLKYSDRNSLYIAEVLVDQNYRKQGLGKKLMQVFDENLENNIKHVLLRVWADNKPAVSLYEKSGFENCAQILQEKLRPDGEQKFTMLKNYMIKSY